jgi:hypothetical protein
MTRTRRLAIVLGAAPLLAVAWVLLRPGPVERAPGVATGPVFARSVHAAPATSSETTISFDEGLRLIVAASERQAAMGDYKTTATYRGDGWTRMEVAYFKAVPGAEHRTRREVTFSRSMLNTKNRRVVTRTASRVVLKLDQEAWTLVDGTAIKHPAPFERLEPAGVAREFASQIVCKRDSYAVEGRDYVRVTMHFPEGMKEKYLERVMTDAQLAAVANPDGLAAEDLAQLVPVRHTVAIDQAFGIVVYDAWTTRSGAVPLERRIDRIEDLAEPQPALFALPSDVAVLVPQDSAQFSEMLTEALRATFNRNRRLGPRSEGS